MCGKCVELFSETGTLTKHKTYSCEECDKLFFETSAPKKHINNTIFDDQNHTFQVF